MNRGVLFSKYPIFAVVQGQTEAIKKRVQSIEPNKLLNASEHDLTLALTDELRLEVPTINEEDIYIAHAGETQVDVSGDPRRMFLDRSQPFYVPGNQTVIAVPFAGDPDFFNVEPQMHTFLNQHVEVKKGELLLTYVRTDQNGAAIKQEYQRTVKAIQENLRSLSQSAAQFNSQLEGQVRGQLKARKDRLLADAGMTASLGLPMKKREGTSSTYAVPITRRTLKIDQINVSGAFAPEPALSNEDYQEILRIMSSMVQVMELSPHAFLTMGEEDLRSHFLVQLNGAFKGQATGETFNFQGKTDILIRVDGRNIFIGECKFWKGEKAFLATLDQLLSYLSWRDTKAAVLLFNRNADFTAVLEKIAQTTPTHPNFKRALGKSNESTFGYIFGQPSDPNREITLTVLAFDIPTAPASVKTNAAGRS